MLTLEGITSEASQKFFVVIDEGTINFELTYKPAIKFWYLDISFKDFSFKGIKLVSSPNILCRYDNLLPFGLNISCIGVDPNNITDFSDKRCVINVLDKDEVDSIIKQYMELKNEVPS